MAKVADFADDVALILEGGFVAIKYGDRETALNCFHAAQLLAPKRQEPKVGLATLALNELDLQNTLRLSQEVIDADPHNYQAMVIHSMGLILLHQDEEKAKKLLNEAKNETKDPATSQLAELWLGYIELNHAPRRPMPPAAKQRISKEISES
jgi:tetratricopeptide (TPR) repeat protein